MPASRDADLQAVERWERAVQAIETPVTDDEAIVMMNALPRAEDDCFGLAFTLQHACETAPNYGSALVDQSTVSGHWREVLLLHLENAERLKPPGGTP
jgi:hypothetical protein